MATEKTRRLSYLILLLVLNQLPYRCNTSLNEVMEHNLAPHPLEPVMSDSLKQRMQGHWRSQNRVFCTFLRILRCWPSLLLLSSLGTKCFRDFLSGFFSRGRAVNERSVRVGVTLPRPSSCFSSRILSVSWSVSESEVSGFDDKVRSKTSFERISDKTDCKLIGKLNLPLGDSNQEY